MPTKTIHESNIGDLIGRKFTPANLKDFKLDLPLSLDVEIADAARLDDIAKDPLLMEELRSAYFGDVIAPWAAKLTKWMTSFDKQYGKMVEKLGTTEHKKTVEDAITKHMNKEVEALKKQGQKAAQDAWNNYVKRMNLGTAYNNAVKQKLAKHTFNVVYKSVKGAVTGLGSAGVGAVMEIRDILGDCAKLVKEIRTLCTDVEKYGKEVNANVESLCALGKKNSKHLAGATDFGKAALNKLLNIDVFKTIDTTIGRNETLEGKLNAAYKRSHVLSVKLNMLLKKNDAAIEKYGSKSKTGMKIFEKQEAKIKGLIDKITTIFPKIPKGLRDVEKNAKTLKGLKNEQPAIWKNLQKALILVDVAENLVSGFDDAKDKLDGIVKEIEKVKPA